MGRRYVDSAVLLLVAALVWSPSLCAVPMGASYLADKLPETDRPSCFPAFYAFSNGLGLLYPLLDNRNCSNGGGLK
eukprot:gene12568-biopygen9417